ncbi:MAG TPA: ClpX C4-type zinc finger protein, partial [Phenylobacterium sp.]
MTDAAEAPARVFHCSFCFKPQLEVEVLVSGPGVFICNECVKLCDGIIAAQPPKPKDPASLLSPERLETDRLLQVLKGYNTAFERVDKAMQDAADILREREVSWAAIGEA